MIKAHKIRLNPSPEQEQYFRKAAGTARFVYSWGLAEWQLHKAEHPGEAHGVMALKKDFNALKGKQYPWVYEVAKGAFTHLGTASKNYSESQSGKRKGAKVGFPKFKSKKDLRQSFHLNNDKFKLSGHALYVPKLGWVNMAEALRFEGKILGAVVSRQAGRWYVSISVELDKPEPIQFRWPWAGMDVGIKVLAVWSDGTQYENQVLLRSELTHLKRLNRRMSRHRMGNQRWYQAKDQLARLHGRIAERRADYLHKMTTQLASTYAVLVIEELNVAGMLKNHRMELSLADASFGEIRRQLMYRATGSAVGWYPSAGSTHPPSCARFGEKNLALTLADRKWICQNCSTHHNRDLNAAMNIQAEALRLLNQTPVVAMTG